VNYCEINSIRWNETGGLVVAVTASGCDGRDGGKISNCYWCCMAWLVHAAMSDDPCSQQQSISCCQLPGMNDDTSVPTDRLTDWTITREREWPSSGQWGGYGGNSVAVDRIWNEMLLMLALTVAFLPLPNKQKVIGQRCWTLRTKGKILSTFGDKSLFGTVAYVIGTCIRPLFV